MLSYSSADFSHRNSMITGKDLGIYYRADMLCVESLLCSYNGRGRDVRKSSLVGLGADPS